MTNLIKTEVAVKRTSDYSIFKTLQGNRDVKPARVKKIKQSIEQRGYIINPIIVNERFEIIDGQGRFEACKQLMLPIYFIVKRGLTIEDCVSMNINSTNWALSDYIRSYAERGNLYYKDFEEYAKRYDLPYYIVYPVLMRTVSRGHMDEVIQSGRFRFDRKLSPLYDQELSFISAIRRNCPKRQAMFAFLFCARVNDVDIDRLIDVSQKYADDIATRARTIDVCETIEEKYNYRLGANKRVYFAHEYKIKENNNERKSHVHL